MSKKKNIDEIRRLKQEGHDQLDAIAKLGFSRNRIYAELAHRLGTTEYSAHFANMYTERDVLKATRLLKEIRSDWVAERKRKRQERAETARRQAEAIRELPEERNVAQRRTEPPTRGLWHRITRFIARLWKPNR